MTRALAHRGPDDEGTWIDGAIGLGHRRLSIRDLSAAGRQPMVSPDGSVALIHNGEIYNDDELRIALEREIGWTFRSRTDTEVLLAGWMAWRDRLVDRLEGMFAFAVWDSRTRELVLVRDPIGIKPLFFAETPEAVLFASEVKGLLPALERRPSWTPGGIHAYLAQGYVGPAATLLDGIAQVPPGTILSFASATRTERRYWQPRRAVDIRTPSDAVDAFLAVWTATLPRMLASDVPLGVLQSGGIDSSLITLSLAETAKVPAFSASFADASHDEHHLARRVAEAAHVPLHDIRIDDEPHAEATFRATVRAFDGQVADSSAYAFYRLCGLVRRHVTVALSGDGGDEFFAGYETYRATRLAAVIAPWTPRALAGAAGRFMATRRRGDVSRLPAREVVARFLLGIGLGDEPHSQWRRLLPSFLMPTVYGPALRHLVNDDPLASYADAVREGGGGDDGALFADQTHYLPADLLMKTDAMSMAHGLEIRVPFLTRAVMELAGRIDPRVLYPAGGPPKAPLRAALTRLGAPSEVTGARKHGFNVPVDKMLRGPLAALGEKMLNDEADRLSPWLSPDAVRTLWREHAAGLRSWGYVLWATLALAVANEEAR